MLSSNKRQIQLLLSLYTMLLVPRTPFKDNINKNTYFIFTRRIEEICIRIILVEIFTILNVYFYLSLDETLEPAPLTI